MMRLDRWLVGQKFDPEHLAVRQKPLAVLDDEAGIEQQLRGLAQQRAVLSRSVGHRRHKRWAEYLVRHLAAKRLEQLQFFGRWRPVRHHVGILEYRMGAR